MDIIIVVLIVAMATNFTVEFLGQLNFTRLDTRVITGWITFPVSFGYHYLLGTEFPMAIVASAASSFLALMLGILVDKINTSVVDYRRARRG